MICAYEECENEFVPKTHNQKYCCDECCRTATNIKIKQKYRENKDRLSGKTRICVTKGCNNRLSRYNESKLCSSCESDRIKKERQFVLDMLSNVIS